MTSFGGDSKEKREGGQSVTKRIESQIAFQPTRYPHSPPKGGGQREINEKHQRLFTCISKSPPICGSIDWTPDPDRIFFVAFEIEIFLKIYIRWTLWVGTTTVTKSEADRSVSSFLGLKNSSWPVLVLSMYTHLITFKANCWKEKLWIRANKVTHRSLPFLTYVRHRYLLCIHINAWAMYSWMPLLIGSHIEDGWGDNARHQSDDRVPSESLMLAANSRWAIAPVLLPRHLRFFVL